MNDNKNNIDLLSAYIDGELNKEELDEINLTLASSSEARQELGRLVQTKSLLHTIPEIKAPVDLLDALEEQAREYVRNQPIPLRRPVSRAMVWSGAWAAAAAVFIAVFVGVHRTAPTIPLDVLVEAHTRVSTDAPLAQHVLSAAGVPTENANNAHV